MACNKFAVPLEVYVKLLFLYMKSGIVIQNFTKYTGIASKILLLRSLHKKQYMINDTVLVPKTAESVPMIMFWSGVSLSKTKKKFLAFEPSVQFICIIV